MVSDCPRCEAPQEFPLQIRETTLPLDGILEKYIRCTTCRWESVLMYTTEHIEHLGNLVAKANKKARVERNQTSTAARLSRRLDHARAQQIAIVEAKVTEVKQNETAN